LGGSENGIVMKLNILPWSTTELSNRANVELPYYRKTEKKTQKVHFNLSGYKFIFTVKKINLPFAFLPEFFFKNTNIFNNSL
jgi:hypothetical protein